MTEVTTEELIKKAKETADKMTIDPKRGIIYALLAIASAINDTNKIAQK